MIEEIWKDAIYITKSGELIDFNGWYQVSNKGRVRSFRARSGGNGIVDSRLEIPRLLSVKSKNDNTYISVTLKVNGKRKGFLLHRLVLSTFVQIPNHLKNEKNIDVNHLDEVKTNNDLSNLEWCSRLENNIHGTRISRAISNGLITKSTEEWKNKNTKGKVYNSRKVVGVNIKTGNVVRFDSMTCVVDFFGIPLADRSVSATIRGRQKTAYGYKWYYEEDYEEQ